MVEDGETCDGDCPLSCSDGIACTTDAMTGAAETCDVVCSSVEVTSCSDGDGCCATGCNSTTDTDCSPSCGNDVIEVGEVCDGDCPTECNDFDSCTTESLVGSAETCSQACSFTEVTSCMSGDDCCPAGCSNTSEAHS